MRRPLMWRSRHECQLGAALLRVQKIEDDYRQRLAELEAKHAVQLAQADDKAAALAGRVTALRQMLAEAQATSGFDKGRARSTAKRLERNRQAAANGRADAPKTTGTGRADVQDGGAS